MVKASKTIEYIKCDFCEATASGICELCKKDICPGHTISIALTKSVSKLCPDHISKEVIDQNTAKSSSVMSSLRIPAKVLG